MLDSSGKISGGLLEGTSSEFGDYDECLDIIVGGRPLPRAHKGSYCLLEIKPPNPVLNALKEYQINRGKGNISLAMSKSVTNFHFFYKIIFRYLGCNFIFYFRNISAFCLSSIISL